MPQNKFMNACTDLTVENAEVISLGAIVGGLLWYKQQLLDSKYIAIALPLAGAVLQFGLGAVLNRAREAREGKGLILKSDFTHMDAQYVEGIRWIGTGDYQKSSDCFKRARSIFEALYKNLEDKSVNDLYVKCCYHEALSRYYLYQYEEAQTLITQTLSHMLPGSSDDLKANLLNLQGLVALIQSYITKYQNGPQNERCQERLNQAKQSFAMSSAVVQHQPNVVFFEKYLNGETDVLVDYIPEQFRSFLSSSINAKFVEPALPLDGADVSGSIMSFLFAEAFMQQGKKTADLASRALDDFQAALSLYQLHLYKLKPGISEVSFAQAEIKPCANAFFEMVIVRLHCLEAAKRINNVAVERQIIAELRAYIRNLSKEKDKPAVEAMLRHQMPTLQRLLPEALLGELLPIAASPANPAFMAPKSSVSTTPFWGMLGQYRGFFYSAHPTTIPSLQQAESPVL